MSDKSRHDRSPEKGSERRSTSSPSRSGNRSSASSRQGSSRSNGGQAPRTQQRAPALNDRYYYEEPPRGSRSGGAYNFEDVSSYSSSAKRERDRRNVKKKSGGKKKVLVVCLVLLALIGGGCYYVFGYMLDGLKVKPITQNNDELGILSGTKTDSTIKNIALFGLDAREDVDEGRSDALMILTVDNRNGKLKLTSILRDSEVYIEGYNMDKVTHAYAYGGAELAIKTLNQNFHLDIEDYVTVNFMQMARIVDAFGGTRVTITAEEAEQINANLDLLASESYDAEVSDGDYIYDSGEVLLNGNQAVAYARIRYIDGDDIRASRQQNVLKGLISQLKNVSKLEYPELIRKIVPMCVTSLDFGDIMGMAPIMFTDFTMETLFVPGEDESPEGGYTDNGTWVYQYDLEQASQHISRFIYEKDSPYYVGE